MTHVYQLHASFVCPLTGKEGQPDRMVHSTTVFATRELAESRFEKFRDIIRRAQKVADDYPIEVFVVPMEVIYE